MAIKNCKVIVIISEYSKVIYKKASYGITKFKGIFGLSVLRK